MSTIWDWINERHAIYLRKTLLEGAATPPVWADPNRAIVDTNKWSLDHLTDDSILATFRFCNVFRELDRVTEWIRTHIREPYADHEYLWYMLMIARELNWPKAIQALMDTQGAWPSHSNFEPKMITRVLTMHKEGKTKWHTGAYMIQAPNKSWGGGISKMEYVAEWVLGKPWEDRKDWIENLEKPVLRSLQSLHALLISLSNSNEKPGYYGWGPFMAYEWVTDLRHTRYLRNAPDINTWANAGPGAIRGLNRIHGRNLTLKPNPEITRGEMVQLLEQAPEHLKSHVPKLELRDVEHSLCEYDKYERVRLGQGRPRAKYHRGRGY